MRSLRRNAPSVPAALQRSASARSARFCPMENCRRRAIATTSGSGRAVAPAIPSLALRAPDGMAGLEVDGSGFIEESSNAAMSDTTSDCKFQKAGVPHHIGTQGCRRIWGGRWDTTGHRESAHFPAIRVRCDLGLWNRKCSRGSRTMEQGERKRCINRSRLHPEPGSPRTDDGSHLRKPPRREPGRRTKKQPKALPPR